eukprot:gene6259-4508_t
MPPNLSDAERSGRRNLVNERMLLSELSRMLHVVKAASTEKRMVEKAVRRSRRQQHSGGAAETKRASRKGKRDAVDGTRKGRSRHSHEGGSVWMVLKGGFDGHQVPVEGLKVRHGSPAAPVAARRATARLEWQLKQRQAALGVAEGYVDSAWREAEVGGLLEHGGTKTDGAGPRTPSFYKAIPSEDGKTYLEDQYATAAQMIAGPYVGRMLHDLVQATSAPHTAQNVQQKGPKQAAIATSPSTTSAPPPAVLEQHLTQFSTQWADVMVRERAIRNGLAEEEKDILTADAIREEVAKAWHWVEEPGSGEGAEPIDGDILPTKCIVRLRNSQHQKHSAVLHTAKAVNSFTSNILKVLRKELANNSVLPRTGREETVPATATAAQKAIERCFGSALVRNRRIILLPLYFSHKQTEEAPLPLVVERSTHIHKEKCNLQVGPLLWKNSVDLPFLSPMRKFPHCSLLDRLVQVVRYGQRFTADVLSTSSTLLLDPPFTSVPGETELIQELRHSGRLPISSEFEEHRLVPLVWYRCQQCQTVLFTSREAEGAILVGVPPERIRHTSGWPLFRSAWRQGTLTFRTTRQRQALRTSASDRAGLSVTLVAERSLPVEGEGPGGAQHISRSKVKAPLEHSSAGPVKRPERCQRQAMEHDMARAVSARHEPTSRPGVGGGALPAVRNRSLSCDTSQANWKGARGYPSRLCLWDATVHCRGADRNGPSCYAVVDSVYHFNAVFASDTSDMVLSVTLKKYGSLCTLERYVSHTAKGSAVRKRNYFGDVAEKNSPGVAHFARRRFKEIWQRLQQDIVPPVLRKGCISAYHGPTSAAVPTMPAEAKFLDTLGFNRLQTNSTVAQSSVFDNRSSLRSQLVAAAIAGNVPIVTLIAHLGASAGPGPTLLSRSEEEVAAALADLDAATLLQLVEYARDRWSVELRHTTCTSSTRIHGKRELRVAGLVSPKQICVEKYQLWLLRPLHRLLLDATLTSRAAVPSLRGMPLICYPSLVRTVLQLYFSMIHHERHAEGTASSSHAHDIWGVGGDKEIIMCASGSPEGSHAVPLQAQEQLVETLCEALRLSLMCMEGAGLRSDLYLNVSPNDPSRLELLCTTLFRRFMKVFEIAALQQGGLSGVAGDMATRRLTAVPVVRDSMPRWANRHGQDTPTTKLADRFNLPSFVLQLIGPLARCISVPFFEEKLMEHDIPREMMLEWYAQLKQCYIIILQETNLGFTEDFRAASEDALHGLVVGASRSCVMPYHPCHPGSTANPLRVELEELLKVSREGSCYVFSPTSPTKQHKQPRDRFSGKSYNFSRPQLLQTLHYTPELYLALTQAFCVAGAGDIGYLMFCRLQSPSTREYALSGTVAGATVAHLLCAGVGPCHQIKGPQSSLQYEDRVWYRANSFFSRGFFRFDGSSSTLNAKIKVDCLHLAASAIILRLPRPITSPSDQLSNRSEDFWRMRRSMRRVHLLLNYTARITSSLGEHTGNTGSEITAMNLQYLSYRSFFLRVVALLLELMTVEKASECSVKIDEDRASQLRRCLSLWYKDCFHREVSPTGTGISSEMRSLVPLPVSAAWRSLKQSIGRCQRDVDQKRDGQNPVPLAETIRWMEAVSAEVFSFPANQNSSSIISESSSPAEWLMLWCEKSCAVSHEMEVSDPSTQPLRPRNSAYLFETHVAQLLRLSAVRPTLASAPPMDGRGEKLGADLSLLSALASELSNAANSQYFRLIKRKLFHEHVLRPKSDLWTAVPGYTNEILLTLRLLLLSHRGPASMFSYRYLFRDGKKVLLEDNTIAYENFISPTTKSPERKLSSEGSGNLSSDPGVPLPVHSFGGVARALVEPIVNGGCDGAQIPSLHQLQEELPSSRELRQAIKEGKWDDRYGNVEKGDDEDD